MHIILHYVHTTTVRLAPYVFVRIISIISLYPFRELDKRVEGKGDYVPKTIDNAYMSGPLSSDIESKISLL